MQEYVVMVSTYGIATVEANSEEEACEIADGYGLDQFDWSDNFSYPQVIEE